ncbi:MAG: hypothetical protein C0399_13105, partial [Syntrophus sp. (in: bacteria)]|nr:hypothetical protein [Syntrophus sp. (in: bacteria)]
FPDEDARFSIFGIHTKNKPLGKDVNLRELAKEACDLAGSDIEFLCRKASMLAIREYINQGSGVRDPKSKDSKLIILKRHFQEALQLVQKQKASIYAGQDDI